MMAVPKIRFKGFADAWEQRKLGEVFEQTAEYVNPKEESIELWSLTVDKGLTPKTERYNREFLVKKEDAFKAVSPNEFIYNPMNMTIGAVALNSMDKKVAVSGYYITMRTKEKYSRDFFSVWLKSPKAIKLYKLYATGSLIEKQRVQFPTLEQIETLVPDKSEQTAIGNFFRTLDDTINLHKRKLDGLKDLKTGYLQQMFPQEGENVPRVRFVGFIGEWEVKRFGDVAVKSGQKNNARQDYPAYSVNNQAGFVPQNEQFEESRLDVLDKSAYKIVQPNEFAYNPARVNVGSIAFNKLDFPVIVSSLYVVVKMMESVDNEFILQFIMSPRFISEVRKNTEGTVREYLFFENFSNILFPYTANKAEQVAIGNFFRNLDEQIAAQQTKLDKLKQLKAAYLQRMFV